MFCFSSIINRLKNKFTPKTYFINNINKDFGCKQKRALICYKTLEYKTDFDNNPVYHPNMYHSLQMIRELIKANYCIDIYECNDLSHIVELKKVDYELMIGFGSLYKKLALEGKVKTKVLFITENKPDVVAKKYGERVEYFKNRHPQISVSNDIPRRGFYDLQQFEVSDYGICMNSSYNGESMLAYFKEMHYINVNGLINQNFDFEKIIEIDKRKKQYVWLGSNGAIHKGLDILIDAFSRLPDLTLNIYGLPESEYQMLKPIFAQNVIYKGKVDILSKEFVDDVISNNLFVISASCSEGMQSGIATGMLHGLIPVVSKETGYEDQPFIHTLPNYNVEEVMQLINSLSGLDNALLKSQSHQVFEYAKDNFTIEAFSKSFSEILKSLS